MVKFQRLNQLSCGLTLVALSATLGGCGLFGGGNTNDPNVKPSPQAASPQTFPSPTLPTTKSGTKVALTRPTNPDERLKVLKSGRNDPFAGLVNSQKADETSGNKPSSAKSPLSPQEKFTKDLSSSYDKFLGKIAKTYEDEVKGKSGSSTSKSGGSQNVPNLAEPGGSQAASPANPEPMDIKVMGIASVGGVPQAIVQAPGEPTSRTVGIGDSLSNGALVVQSIDVSNPADPVVVFRQGSIAFSVGVGREPAIVASR